MTFSPESAGLDYVSMDRGKAANSDDSGPRRGRRLQPCRWITSPAVWTPVTVEVGAAERAICTGDGRKLSSELVLTARRSGPAEGEEEGRPHPPGESPVWTESQPQDLRPAQQCCPRGRPVWKHRHRAQTAEPGPDPASGTTVPARDRGKSGPKPLSCTPNTAKGHQGPPPETWGDSWAKPTADRQIHRQSPQLRWRLPYAAGSYHVQRGGRTISTRFQMDSASSTRAVGA